ncbi:hypothetical protein [Deinococcus cellulosilyticus]|uniref:Uncharacterized protein n=1 Tax=Deinococcus cellulosilyticus (strain DSM 18568 / NBRC 106333 / KACC 11606 / 5516J-15) TaxID=1223518 RepID=A0A511N428_DEIC1|nr:hypothetical protein [Deinococcus cellulosilyticus]GEM47629.1 hypothetical protein DC3_32640 [Deinococcus cellulosilyticus NBRC 106333 = KACC 11606]
MDFLTPEQLQTLRAPLIREESSEVLERLNTLFAHDWSLELDVFDVEHPTVRARLRIQHITRDGLGQAESLKEAEKRALLSAARVLGMGTGEATAQASTAPAEPAKPKAHQHIDELMEKCNQVGLGLEAAKLSMQYKGYGETLEDSRKLYVALRELLKKNGHHA